MLSKIKKALQSLRTKARAPKPASKAVPVVRREPPTKPIGEVTHYFSEIGVAVVKFQKGVAVGETVHFFGATTDFGQPIDSMQRDHKRVAKAAKGQEIGIKVKDRVRAGDKVYKKE